MDKDIWQISYELKQALDNDKRVILLNSLEEEMNNNEQVMVLAYKKDLCADEYSSCLNHYSEDSDQTKNAQNKLYLAKKELEEHPLVKQYLKAYRDVRILYEKINDLLFSILNVSVCRKEK